MSILIPQPVTPQEPTLEQKQEGYRKAVLQFVSNSYKMLIQTQKRGNAYLWSSPKLTPQQACDALGTDASKLIQFHAVLTQALRQLAAIDGSEPDIALPKGEIVINEDGTVTVTPTPEDGTVTLD